MNEDRADRTWSIEVSAPLQEVLDRSDTPKPLRHTLQGSLPWQTRNETPIERELISPRQVKRWIAALLALGATVTVVGDHGPQELPLERVLEQRPEGQMTTLNVVIPPNQRWGEAQVARTPADEPIVVAVAAVSWDEASEHIVERARLALVGAWPQSVRLAEAASQLEGQPLDQEHLRAVAQAIEKEVSPQDDFLGSEEYRRAMAAVLSRRALEQCLS